MAKIFNKCQKISPIKSFWKLWVWFFPANHSRPSSLQSCGFGGKNKTQSFQKLFSGDIFLYLLNISATAAPKLNQKKKNYSSVQTIVNHWIWLDDSPPLNCLCGHLCIEALLTVKLLQYNLVRIIVLSIYNDTVTPGPTWQKFPRSL